jgi:branched-chain amino acid transport system substrate-binding protein
MPKIGSPRLVLSRRKALGVIAGAAAAGLPATVRAADPVKIGVALSLSGRFADSALRLRDGYQLWADEVNAQGGLGGRPLQLIIYDDESNPDTGRVLAERLISRDGVFMVLGPYSSPITDAVATACERAEVPLIGTIASDPSIWARRKLSWSFQAFPSADYDHDTFLSVISKFDKTKPKLAIVFEETPFSVGAKNHAVVRAKELGIPTETFGYAPGAQDFSSIVEHIIASGATSVSMGGYLQPAIALSRVMSDRAYNPLGYHFILAAEGATKDALGANVNGIFGRSAWEPGTGNAMEPGFTKAFQAKFKSLPTYHSAVAYAAGQLITAAVKAEGFDRKKIRTFLASQSVPTLLGTYKVNEKNQQVGYRYVLVQWQGGERKLIGADSVTGVVWPKPKWA